MPNTTNNITAVLIDDLELARVSLRADIEDHCPQIDIIGEADSVVSGAKLLRSTNPDLVFLDIEMNGDTGFDLLDIMPQINTKVIFVTGSTEYAIKAFQYSAIDYLLKPVDGELLKKAVEKVQSQLSVNANQIDIFKHTLSDPTRLDKIALHTTDQILVVPIDTIVRLESMGNYTHFYLSDGSKVLITKTLKMYDDMLSTQGFLRVHQSHLVNTNYISAYMKTEGGYIKMKDGSDVPVSVRKKSTVIDLLS